MKNQIGVLRRAHVTVKDHGVPANDDKWHSGTSQELKEGQRVVRTWHRCVAGANLRSQYRL